MWERTRTPVVLGLVSLAGTLGLGASAGQDPPVAEVRLRTQAGEPVGVVIFTQESDDKVQVRATAHHLPPGFHGFHVHTVGVCVPPFLSAGGHYNPDGAGHHDHAGDMPVLLVKEDGTAELRFTTDRYTVAELTDGNGSAVIVHVGPDNYANVPQRYLSLAENVLGADSSTLATGDAGGRLACGVVR
ncbi:superoxide dismutase family protein [Jiangella aurantiaca]|uniref:Superoxide dismutase [Cu-Zn] n=1 Tax=Jiangella aurantiaca TaxID=2530373 RepID=A0A4R5A7N5_9ACTN|nr:superoxide dismutase family protein [Jiangella aurantiaca]TDD68178.1 superoxide dismutase family protein [Jiangella aurantiaca]